MEDIVALIMIFGGGATIAISFSPVGKAIADRIRGHREVAEGDPAVYEELDRMRQELTELQERVDFTERLLARGREAEQLPDGQ
ncbi:MAG: hypothetical protein IPK12_17090 [Gemmatimonadetes bacterium]|nr:hypothetical protein [Gemmatimonadota bacterium]